MTEARRKANRKWREANPEKARESNRRWKANNPDKVRASQRKAKQKWRAANPDKVRAQNLRHAYGISPEEYDQMLTSQGGVCANRACKSSDSLVVDHNHVT